MCTVPAPASGMCLSTPTSPPSVSILTRLIACPTWITVDGGVMTLFVGGTDESTPARRARALVGYPAADSPWYPKPPSQLRGGAEMTAASPSPIWKKASFLCRLPLASILLRMCSTHVGLSSNARTEAPSEVVALCFECEGPWRGTAQTPRRPPRRFCKPEDYQTLRDPAQTAHFGTSRGHRTQTPRPKTQGCTRLPRR